MNAKVNPEGERGSVTFTTGVQRPAVRVAGGGVYVRSANPNLWLPCDDVTARPFVADGEMSPDQHCFREDNCGKHPDHTGDDCCCCGWSADLHSGCDCA